MHRRDGGAAADQERRLQRLQFELELVALIEADRVTSSLKSVETSLVPAKRTAGARHLFVSHQRTSQADQAAHRASGHATTYCTVAVNTSSISLSVEHLVAETS